jgi:nucleoside-diphosphate-sugar epimerase
MTMPEAIDATLALAAADGERLTQCVYAIRSFSASAGTIADLVRRFFPSAHIDFVPDEARQAIVDSWPTDVDDSAARRDWGFAPQFGLEDAFEQYLIPAIRARYA